MLALIQKRKGPLSATRRAHEYCKDIEGVYQLVETHSTTKPTTFRFEAANYECLGILQVRMPVADGIFITFDAYMLISFQ